MQRKGVFALVSGCGCTKTVSVVDESHPNASDTVNVKTVNPYTVAEVFSAVESLMAAEALSAVHEIVFPAVSVPVPSSVICVAVFGHIRTGETEAFTLGEGLPTAVTMESDEHPVNRSVTVSVNASPLQPYPIVAGALGFIIGVPFPAVQVNEGAPVLVEPTRISVSHPQEGSGGVTCISGAVFTVTTIVSV